MNEAMKAYITSLETDEVEPEEWHVSIKINIVGRLPSEVVEELITQMDTGGVFAMTIES